MKKMYEACEENADIAFNDVWNLFNKEKGIIVTIVKSDSKLVPEGKSIKLSRSVMEAQDIVRAIVSNTDHKLIKIEF